MGKKNKLKRFNDLNHLPNVFQNFNFKEGTLRNVHGDMVDMRGKWLNHFNNNYPIVLELACGKGEYTVGLYNYDSEKNYIGVDLKGARIWVGATAMHEAQNSQIAFIRSRIENLNNYFGADEVQEIWITFPDPHLKSKSDTKRLTAPMFLDIYAKILKNNGVLHLKTDSPVMYEYTLKTIEAHPAYALDYHDDDIYAKPLYCEELAIKTYYENKDIAGEGTVKYVRAIKGQKKI